MEIKNFSSLQKNLLKVVLAVLLSSCTQVQTRKSTNPTAPSEKFENEAVEEQETTAKREKPRVGIVLGGGGMKTYAHVGVLQAFEKARIPIHAIVGLEWGALVAALYASKGRTNDLEWQFFKLSEPDFFEKSFLGGSGRAPSVRKMDGFLKKTLEGVRFSDLRIAMTCPSRRLAENRLIWKDSGSVAQSMKSCLAYPPFFRSQKEIAAPFALQEAAVKLNQMGANVIVFVNVLKNGRLFISPQDADAFKDVLIWQRVQETYETNVSDFDEVLGLYLKNIGLKDFSKRRALLKKGRQAGDDLVKRLSEKYGL